MKRFSVFVAFLMVISLNLQSVAKPIPAPQICTTTDLQKYNFTKIKDQHEYNNIINFIKKVDEYSNLHNPEMLETLYAPEYVNGDGVDRSTLITLIKETWRNFPDMKFLSNVESVHITNGFATIETFDIAKGTTAEPSDLTKDYGELTSNSKVVLYLKKYGNRWKIISDKVVYEKTYLRYGKAKSFTVDISAPEQVFSGDEYTTKVLAEIPKGVVALGSISREPIVYPEVKSEEIFRQIPENDGVLERIMKANSTNNNELAVASIGFTELVQDFYQNAQIKLTGMVLMMQRVNVIPKSTFEHSDAVVAQSACNEK